MSKININNYEAFYLDYLEGNLSEEDIAQLNLFLDSNPDIKAELEEFQMLELSTPEVEFDKSSLHQNINESNVEDYIIASLEKVIDPDDELELNEYLNQSEDAMAMANRYKRTILPQRDLTYPEKSKLKKRGAPIFYLAPLIGAAAAVFLFFIINPILSEKQELQYQKLLTENIEEAQLPIDSTINEISLATEKESITQTVVESEKITDITVTSGHGKTIRPVQPVVSESFESKHEEEDLIFAENKSIKKLIPVDVSQLENNWRNNGIALLELENKDEILYTEVAHEQQIAATSKRGINLFKLLELGVKGFNALNERDYAVLPTYGVSGKLQTVTLITDERTITTPAI